MENDNFEKIKEEVENDGFEEYFRYVNIEYFSDPEFKTLVKNYRIAAQKIEDFIASSIENQKFVK